MKEQTVKGALKELKGQILNTWETRADEELEKAKENVSQLSGVFQEKMDLTKQQFSKKLNQLLSRFNAGFESAEKTSAARRKAPFSSKSSTPHN